MAEGFFHPNSLAIPNVDASRLSGAMVRIVPKTRLVLDLAQSSKAAIEQARNESMPDGSECWYRFFTRDDLARVHDPEFSMGMVRHEFSRLVRQGATFPATDLLDGGGTGFCFDKQGLVLTNYHLVTGEVANYHREAGAIGAEVLCKGLRAEVAQIDNAGNWFWAPASRVWLVSNPSTDRAVWEDEHGQSHLREDTAVLRIEPPPPSTLDLSCEGAVIGEPVWMTGFPLRSARPQSSLAKVGYADADGTLRVSRGVITDLETPDYFTTDLDGSMGSSGSPVFNSNGRVIGMFSRATGNGPKNAFEYGHMKRVHVSTGLAASGLRLGVPSL
ncbi:MAG: serine protease [Hylemonella sp.]|nr:serine protease [Hylemonella sp.]